MRLIQYDRPMSNTIDQLLRSIKGNWIEKLKLKIGIDVLDVGCGYGQDVIRISKTIRSTGKVFGLEINLTELMGIDSKIRNKNCFVAADAQRIPFGQNVFDLIWSDRLLQHVEEPELALQELARVSKPGGLFMLADSDHYSTHIHCKDSKLATKLMHYRASLVQNGDAGIMLSDWCKKIGVEVLELEQHHIVIDDFSMAKNLGLFFHDWHLKYSQLDDRCKKEIDFFMNEMETLDSRNEFLYKSKFYALFGKLREEN